MALTYTPIATQTLGSAVSSITFNSIPSTYTDLVLILSGTATGSQDVIMTFNGDSASNYSDTIIYGNGSASGSTRHSNNTGIYTDYYGSMGTEQNTHIINVMNYSNSITYKTAIMRANRAASGTDAIVGLWRSTAAITILSLTMAATNFQSGTVATLYGIKAA